MKRKTPVRQFSRDQVTDHLLKRNSEGIWQLLFAICPRLLE